MASKRVLNVIWFVLAVLVVLLLVVWTPAW